LTHYVETEEFREDESGLHLGEAWLEASRRGEIHSNIESRSGVEV